MIFRLLIFSAVVCNTLILKRSSDSLHRTLYDFDGPCFRVANLRGGQEDNWSWQAWKEFGADMVAPCVGVAKIEDSDPEPPDEDIIIECYERCMAFPCERTRVTLENLSTMCCGQELAVEKVRRLIKRVKNGWTTRSKPLVLAFLGPSGTGKTELARLIACVLHGLDSETLDKSKRFIILSMTQHQHEHSVASLVGPHLGIQGEGLLTGALLEHPDAVVLLDEFEKGHPRAIPDLFLGAFQDHGMLKDDKRNKIVRTHRAVFILTSNMGAKEVTSRWSEIEDARKARPDKQLKQDDKVVMKIDQDIAMVLNNKQDSNPFFRPEFRGRVDKFVTFYPISYNERIRLIEMKLREKVLSHYLHHKDSPMVVGWTMPVVRHLADAYDSNQGFRPVLGRLEEVCDVLGEALDAGEIVGGQGALVYLDQERHLKVRAVNDSRLVDLLREAPPAGSTPLPPAQKLSTGLGVQKADAGGGTCQVKAAPAKTSWWKAAAVDKSVMSPQTEYEYELQEMRLPEWARIWIFRVALLAAVALSIAYLPAHLSGVFITYVVSHPLRLAVSRVLLGMAAMALAFYFSPIWLQRSLQLATDGVQFFMRKPLTCAAVFFALACITYRVVVLPRNAVALP